MKHEIKIFLNGSVVFHSVDVVSNPTAVFTGFPETHRNINEIARHVIMKDTHYSVVVEESLEDK